MNVIVFENKNEKWQDSVISGLICLKNQVILMISTEIDFQEFEKYALLFGWMSSGKGSMFCHIICFVKIQ